MNDKDIEKELEICTNLKDNHKYKERINKIFNILFHPAI